MAPSLNPETYVNGTNLKGWDLILLIFGGLLAAVGVGISAIIDVLLSGVALLPRGIASWIFAAGNGAVNFVATLGTGIWSTATGVLGFVPAVFQPIVAIGFGMFFLFILIRGENL